MVLDLTSGRLSDAISHVEKALESVESRMALLRDGLSNQVPAAPPPEEQKPDIKGKGKATAKLARDDPQSMTKSQMESELKELSGLKDDLALKVWTLCSLEQPSRSSSSIGRRTQMFSE
jgi:HAT1-interacting factor 1